jgi:hypothetical protein
MNTNATPGHVDMPRERYVAPASKRVRPSMLLDLTPIDTAAISLRDRDDAEGKHHQPGQPEPVGQPDRKSR